MRMNGKRSLAVLLLIAQLFCLSAGAAWAEYGQDTGSRLGNTAIHDGVYLVVADDGSLAETGDVPQDRGFLRYDVSSAQLWLKDFHYICNDMGADASFAALTLSADVTIVLVGDNELTNNGYYTQGEDPEIQKVSNGIQAQDHCVTFSGNGTLTVRTVNENIAGYGVASTVSSVFGTGDIELTVSGETAAFQASPIISDGLEVTASAGSDEWNRVDTNGSDGWTYVGNAYVTLTVQESWSGEDESEDQETGEEAALQAEEQQAAEEAAAEEAARQEAEQQAAEEAAAEEAAREAAEQAAAEEAAREAAEQAAADEAARQAAEQAAAEEAARQAAEQAAAQAAADEAARQAAEQAAAQAAADEAARQAAEQQAATQAAAEEAARQAAEQAAAEEAARQAAEQAAAEEAARQAAEQAASEQKAAEEAEAARLAEERAEQERQEAEQEAAMLQSGIMTMSLEDEDMASEYVSSSDEDTPMLSGYMLTGNALAAPATPDVTFTANGDNSGVLSNADNTMQYRYSYQNGDTTFNSEWKAITPTDGQFVLSGLAAGYTIQIKRVSEGVESEVQSIVLTQQKKPSEIATVTSTAVTAAGNDGKLTVTLNADAPTGVSFSYRKAKTSDSFTSDNMTTDANGGIIISGLSDLADGYELRTNASGTTLASAADTYTIGSYVAPTKLATPTATFTATGEDSGTLSGFTITANCTPYYSLDNGAAWVQITTDPVTIASGITGGILVQARGDGTTTANSDNQQIAVQQYAAPDKANLVVKNCSVSTDNNGTITVNYGTATEYKRSTDTVYTDVKDKFITNLTPGDYDIRFKANGNILASKPTTLTVAKYEAPKTVVETKITMSPASTTLTSTDSSATLSVTFDPLTTTNQTVYWSSTNDSVVRVHDSYKTTVGANGVATASVIAVGTGTATIVAQTANGHVAYCDVTVQANYYFTYHKNGTWYYDVGGSYTVQTTGPASRLTALKINGQTVNPYYYSVTAASDGSTIVTISQTCMQALNHAAYQRLRLEYSDGGSAECYLHILSVKDKPITGDDSTLGLWLGLMAVSCAGVAALVITRRKKKK